MALNWSSLLSKASGAACFMANNYLSSDFEKSEHMHGAALYSSKAVWISIFACHALKPILK